MSRWVEAGSRAEPLAEGLWEGAASCGAGLECCKAAGEVSQDESLGLSIASFCSLISSVFKGLANVFGPRSYRRTSWPVFPCCSLQRGPSARCLGWRGTPGSKGVAAALCSHAGGGEVSGHTGASSSPRVTYGTQHAQTAGEVLRCLWGLCCVPRIGRG